MQQSANLTQTLVIQHAGSNYTLTGFDAIKYERTQYILKIFKNGNQIQSIAKFNLIDWQNFLKNNAAFPNLKNRTQWAWFDKCTITNFTGIPPQIAVQVDFDPNSIPPYLLTGIK